MAQLPPLSSRRIIVVLAGANQEPSNRILNQTRDSVNDKCRFDTRIGSIHIQDPGD